MRLRTAQNLDAASLAALSIEVWLATYLRQGVNAFFAQYVLAEFTTQRFEALIGAPGEHIVVAELQMGVCGYVRVSSGRAGPVDGCSDTEISTLYVQARHHGKGLGKALLGRALEHCRTSGAGSVWLTTNSENAPALAFYRAQGFRRIGKTHFEIQDQAYPNDVLTYALD